MQPKQQRFPLGSHLIVKHFGYSHHGIYAGRGRVIHYSGFAHIFKKHPIEMTTIERFARGKTIYTRLYPSPRYQAKAVVKRMRSRMHENHYHLIINNCEHLCTWAITGVESSTQVERMQRRLATIGYVSSIMSYMNSLMLTVATACFAIVLYIKLMLRKQAKKTIPTYLQLKKKTSKK
ncbi:lecithin retinol acyltransferase family protein [Acinetobacter beijerinckii]|uniref:lecithin retinol acyltransferase family protein n=1 Tax=Acinetobacter TaxID=469 RepID=UPI0020C95CE2|nr:MULTISPECIES: lecithin retinol acyltransferase family protein [Acinetobacter]UTO20860.1 lecithin retinol acyltransferase family protein [Acinetobacter sp. Z1]